jgi:FkbM family methyltransferase
VYLHRSLELDRHVNRVRKRRVAIQAGGHIGIYPKKLAEDFEHVYTFEPDWENFACLAINAALPNVYAMRAALGTNHRGAALIRGKNSGGHQIDETAGPIPMLRIDDLALEYCDAIFLDLEGYEIPALKGAQATLGKYRPLLVLEENKKAHRLGYKYGDLESLLAPLDYRPVERVGEDIVFECAK